MSARRGNMARHVTRWSAEQDKTLLALLAEGKPTAEIGDAMRRTKESVQCRLHVLRTRPTDAAPRKCLCCGQLFDSAWKGNRMCSYCARQAQGVSPYAP